MTFTQSRYQGRIQILLVDYDVHRAPSEVQSTAYMGLLGQSLPPPEAEYFANFLYCFRNIVLYFHAV